MNPTTYHVFNREERNHVAILYHLLLSGSQNLNSFLGLDGIGVKDLDPTKAEVYFEFAYLRDRWKRLSNDERKVWLLEKLEVPAADPLWSCSIEDFNRVFSPRGGASKERIQSPANWMPASTSGMVPDRLRRVYLMKWCFNLKPDLVVITSDGLVVCVEAKLESGEDQYTAELPNGERYIQSQRQCQELMFTELLEVPRDKYKPVLLVRRISKRRAGSQVAWSKVYGVIQHSDSHPFVKRWLAENQVYKPNGVD